MKVWTFHCYGTLPEHGQMTRHYNFGKYLSRFGHDPVVFVGSHPHNTNIQLITGKEKYKVYQCVGDQWSMILQQVSGNYEFNWQITNHQEGERVYIT